MPTFEYSDGKIVEKALSAIEQRESFSVIVRGKDKEKVKRAIDSYKTYHSGEHSSTRRWPGIHLLACWYRYVSAFQMFQLVLNADSARMTYSHVESGDYLRVDFNR